MLAEKWLPQWPMLWNYVKKIKILLICKAVNQSFWQY